MRLSIMFLFLSLTTSAVAQQIDEKAIDAIAAEVVRTWRIPGIAIGVVKDDRVVYLRGHGVKELGGTAAVTPDTVFQIASTTKAFTTTAMAMLVDDKKMSWDDPVRKHVDYFRLGDPCADTLVTLRDIVSHRTGLARHDELWDNTPWTRTEIIRRVATVPLTKTFRGAYQYQNIMFVAAGEAIAAASGMPWDDFLKKRLFDPLGMTRTHVAEREWTRADRSSTHYYDARRGTITVKPGIDVDNVGAAGAIKSSARDMTQWLRFQLAGGTIDGKRLISAAALNETKKPHTVIGIAETSRDIYPVTNFLTYGLGWNVSDYRGELLVSHGGALNYFRTQVALLPKQNAGVVVMVNMNRGHGAIAIRNTILDMILGRHDRDWSTHFLAVEKRLDGEGEKNRREREAKRHRDTKPSRDLAAYAGTYESVSHGAATVALRDGILLLRWNRLAIPLRHYHYDVFIAEDEEAGVDEQLVFRLGPDGEVKILTIFGQEFLRVGQTSSQPSGGGG